MKKFCSFLFALAIICASCTEKHFITDRTYRHTVDSLFNLKKELAHNRDSALFNVFLQNISLEGREALQFLYAFMPINDLADYDGEFYLENVRAAFTARREMAWGKEIPHDIFRHFVLPVRVNNENMDNSRTIFYDELKARVQNLSLHDAALEVNHWCHEKVTYAPSDGRTSSPLASVRSAIGRCGEESTFAVAAMRSVGIPARQVYTPRWAHTDDNHAWIEVWVDGDWYYMGACEPEPVLNLGWFSSPVKRAMLLHTKVFGKYFSKQDIINETNCFTEINVIENYAPTKKVKIQIVDIENNPVKDATVDFGLYNYAEFYPIASKKTNADGIATLTVGLGDLLIRAYKDGMFGYQKLAKNEGLLGLHKMPKEAETIILVIDKKEGELNALDLDVTPPAELPVNSKISEEQRRENDHRLQEENDIRKQYEATFYTQEKAKILAEELNVDASLTWKYLQESRGNYAEIEKFLRATTPENSTWAFDLLSVISKKDLRDTPSEILIHHLENSSEFAPHFKNEIFINYVLNPRVANELLSAYRNAFGLDCNIFSAPEICANPKIAIDYFKNLYTINDDFNPQQIPITAKGFAELKVGDTYSANIAAIAFLRSLGFAARLEPATKKLQYYNFNQWHDFSLAKTNEQKNSPQGKLFLKFTPDDALKTPQYEIHYTLSKFTNGKFNVLPLDDNGEIFGETTLVNKTFNLDAGYYLLTTGRRLANGSVLSRLEFFNIEQNTTTTVPLIIRYSKEELQIIGSMNPESK